LYVLRRRVFWRGEARQLKTQSSPEIPHPPPEIPEAGGFFILCPNLFAAVPQQFF
jgi:hypothetical protein